MARVTPSEFGLTEELTCSVCCDLLNEPVMLDCMHHFCKACILRFWSSSQQDPSCPHCRRVIPNRFFRTNHLLQKVVEQVKKCSTSDYYRKTQKYLNDLLNEKENQSLKLGQMKREAEKKISEVEETGKEICQHIADEFKHLREILAKEEKAMLSVVQEEERDAVSLLQDVVQKLEKQISDLSEEMVSIYRTQKKTGDSFFVEAEAVKKWKPLSIDSSVLLNPDMFDSACKGPVQYMVWRRMLKSIHPVPAPLTFDPASAHPSLIFSHDFRSVMESERPTSIPSADMSHRYLQSINVLASQSFSSGRHYWEIWVGNKTKWDVGLASSTVNRKIRVKLSPENGYWAIRLRGYQQYWAASCPWTPLHVDTPLKKIGVYLDCGEEQVSFFNADNMTHLYTYRGIDADCFYPFFSTCFRDGQKNSEPMRINLLNI
ncbi:zinc-binding protein A33 [Bombina bombina]|uniref:zinc-binding protein A33 n=1 Tax=Bombina bombina TaxID=8345 RepID=UPI00235AB495|nr:zinc-binding protein A33 [Bombina bombina]